MKFLVLALCVYAASAADNYRSYRPWQKPVVEASVSTSNFGYQPTLKTFASVEPIVTSTAVPRYYSTVQAEPVDLYISSTSKPSFKNYNFKTEETYKPNYKTYSFPSEQKKEVVYEKPSVKYFTTVQPEEPMEEYVTKSYSSFEPEMKRQSYSKDAEATIEQMDSEVNADGFAYNYRTNNGISAQSVGTMKKVNDVNVLTVEGGYQYPVDGKSVVLTYTADENGYHPKSDLLPTSPPMPKEIVRLLEYLSEHYNPETSSKQY